MTTFNSTLSVPRSHERRLPSSTDGRFVILDEKNRDSDGFDETSSSDNDSNDNFQFSKSCYISKCSSPNIPHLNYSISQPSRMTTAHSTSRFKIVPIESKYKRGRWEAFDYYDPKEPKRPILSENNREPGWTSNFSLELGFVANKKPHQPMSQTVQRAPLATPEPMSSRSLASEPEDGDQENNLPFRFPPNVRVFNDTIEEDNTLGNDDKPRLATSPEFFNGPLSGRITPSEMLHQYGLERSLSATSYGTDGTVHVISHR
ncbi:unnamed protein product [Bursaphelenchus okinawaensis]|uniref:Uncharacterized protein n=1 Tax=Bursaphelenchus okinawaensis TaxID=465554 RepID=A0A811LL19_9BILA|nr:unnamed protein product [Bursaphelenchus okinawaensis]CAG9125327.1 unnamed protein product [Bursaphelenchus okinawaensis]